MPGMKIQNSDIAPFVIKEINSEICREVSVHFKLRDRIIKVKE